MTSSGSNKESSDWSDRQDTTGAENNITDSTPATSGNLPTAPTPAAPTTPAPNSETVYPTYSYLDSSTPDVSAPGEQAKEPYRDDTDFSPLSGLERARLALFLVWTIIGAIVLFVGAWFLLGRLTSAIAVVVIAAFSVFLLRTPVDMMERRGVPRWLGALIAYLTGLAILFVIGLIIVPVLARQMVGLISLVPDYISRANTFFEYIYENYGHLLEDSNINQIVGSFSDMLSEWAVGFVAKAPSSAISIGTNLVTVAVVFLVSLVAGYWILRDLPVIKLEVRTLISPRYQDDMAFVASACARAIGGYLRGMIVVGTCVGLACMLGFTLIGLPYPVLLGLIAGIMMFIPVFGSWVTCVIVVSLGFFVSPLTALLAMLIVVVSVQLTDSLITPRVMSSMVELHPAIILVGVLIGGALAGVVGLIAAIPLLASAKSVFVYYFEKNQGRRISHYQGALFKKSREKNREKPDTNNTENQR